VSVVDKAIEDGVGQGWIARRERGMPVLDRQLGDDHRRTELAAIVDDLEQVLGLDQAGRGE